MMAASGFLPRVLGDRRILWPGYVVVMYLVSAVCFGSLKDHLLDVHDHETFQDNVAIGEDFSFFFSLEKQQPTGRPAADLVKYIAYEIGGNDPGFFHLLVVAVHTLAAIILASLSRRLGMGLRLSLAGHLLDGEYGEVSSAGATRMGIDLLEGGRVEEAVRAFRQSLE